MCNANRMIIKTGIFWFVRGEMIADRVNYAFEEQEEKDFIDYPYSHFEMWDKLSNKRFPYADFAAYPRGRLLFDVKKGKYLLYLDRCITDTEIKMVIKFYDLEKDKYILSRDEHYCCDRCYRMRRI